MIFIGSKKKFEEKYISKDELNKYVKKSEYDEVVKEYNRLSSKIDDILKDTNHYFVPGIGDVVYDVKYRTKNGRFCSNKGKASKEKSSVEEKVVTEENFLYVRQAIKDEEMFITKEEAQSKIDSLSE